MQCYNDIEWCYTKGGNENPNVNIWWQSNKTKKATTKMSVKCNRIKKKRFSLKLGLVSSHDKLNMHHCDFWSVLNVYFSIL